MRFFTTGGSRTAGAARALIVGGALVLVSAALGQTRAQGPPGGVPSGTYGYAQAKQLGLRTPPTPEQVGLPTCHPDPMWQGFSEAAAAARAVAAAPERAVCAADPRTGTFSTGVPAPHAGYHHNGVQTANKFEGGRTTPEVGNPTVDHRAGAPYEFVVARPLAKTDAGYWIEDGWAEVSWKANDQYVYTYTHPGDTWYFPSGYPLNVGSFYPFRVRDSNSTSGWAEIYWSGSWQLLDTNGSMHCEDTNGNHNCYIETYLEIYSEDSTPHPDMNAPAGGTGVDFNDGRLRTADGTWPQWTTAYSSYPGSVDPYVVCWNSKWYDFRAGKNLTC